MATPSTIEAAATQATAIDADGYRPNVGIVICNQERRLLWARRSGQGGWQFPQGGIERGESPHQAMFRELWEEVGLTEADVKVLSCTDNWLYYRLPKKFIRHKELPLCIGQKQLWFLLGLEATDGQIALGGSDRPEFDDWCWVDYWYPAEHVIAFKREVYRQALQELERPFNCYQSAAHS